MNILNITSNGLSINSIDNDNSSVLINSFNNTTALKLKNNYLPTTNIPNILTEYINVNNYFNINYNTNGINYTKIDNYLKYVKLSVQQKAFLLCFYLFVWF